MSTARRRSLDPDEIEPKRTKTDYQNAFSRACRICTSGEPHALSVLSPCGHVVCRACSLQIKSDASKSQRPVNCSMCRCVGTFSLMIEELKDGYQEGQCGSDESADCADPLQSRDREVADDERISASDEDLMINEVEAAWPAYVNALQEEIDAVKAVAPALRKIHDQSSVAVEAGKAAGAASQISYERRKAWVAVLESHIAMKRAPTDEEITANDEAILSDRNTAAQLNAEYEEAKAKMSAAEAAAAPLIAAKEQATKTKNEWKAKVEQVENLIERFKRTNEDCASRGLRFSRACRACSIDNPRLRSFFPACGHAVCRECADRATASEADTSCPMCHVEGTVIPLFEESEES